MEGLKSDLLFSSYHSQNSPIYPNSPRIHLSLYFVLSKRLLKSVSGGQKSDVLARHLFASRKHKETGKTIGRGNWPVFPLLQNMFFCPSWDGHCLCLCHYLCICNCLCHYLLFCLVRLWHRNRQNNRKGKLF